MRSSVLMAIGLAVIQMAPAATIKIDPHNFTVPDGFIVERVAGPPLVDRPVVADFDQQGRLYVADSSGTNDKVEKQLQDKPHRIVRLEDTNKDGRFDKSVVFADKMMFPEGAMWLEGSLYVSAPPSICKLTDTDNDGVADKREEWFKGQTLTGCANDLHGPYRGPDGWIYWCKGAFAKQTYEKFATRAAHIFRARPDGTGVEAVMTGGMDNPVDVVFTPGGERIFTTTFFQHPAGGKRDGLVHAVYGGVYGKVHDVIDDHKRTSGEVMPVLTHMGPAAPCGLVRYESAAFGRDYQDNLFACAFNLHKVSRHVLEAEGATYKTHDHDFLVSDNTDFHPTDVIEAVDGSLLVIDTGGWYKLCCPTSQLPKPDVLGAIYRVHKKEPEPIRSHTTNDVWALTRAGDRAAVRALLDAKDPIVRQAALHSISLWRDSEALPAVIAKLKDSNPHLQRVAAEALGRIGNPKAVPALLEAAGKKHDRFLEHSITYALIEIGDAKTTATGLQAKSIHTQRAALIALDQMGNGGLKADTVIALLDSKELKDTAWWIVSHHSEWGEALAKYFRTAQPDAHALASLAKNPAIQDLIAEMLRAKSCDVALRAMAKSGLKAAPEEWVNALMTVLRGEGACVKEAVAACRSLSFAKEHAPKIAEALKATPKSVRLEALAALPGTGHEISAESFALACEHLNTAGGVLTKAKLSKEQLLALVPFVKQASPLDLAKVLAPFENCGDEMVGLKLVESLRDAKGLNADALKRLAKFPEPVQKEINALLDTLNVDAAKQKAHLEALLSSLKDGDIRRGQGIFNNPKAACATCHAIGYLGGNLGPDLTRIGQVRTERDLLEAVLYPSASFVRSYEPVIVATKSGDEHSGVLRKDSPDEVILGTGPDLEVRIPRSDITDMRPGAVSVMPQGLDQQISKQELADLIAFLRATRW